MASLPAVILVYFDPFPLQYTYQLSVHSTLIAIISIFGMGCVCLILAKRKVKHDTDINTIQRSVN
jgi:hypothetical protein